MCKLRAVVGLNFFRGIAKVGDGAPDKVHRAEAAVLLVGENETLPAGLVKHGILEEHFVILACITGLRDILYVHLPFLAQLRRRIVFPQMPGLLLCGLDLPAIPQTYEDSVQRARMSAVCLSLPKLPVQLTDTDVRIAPVVVPDPCQLFLCVRVGMLTVRSVTPGLQRLSCPVILFVPPHQ